MIGYRFQWALSIYLKFLVKPVEMKMKRADPLEIYQNKRTAFGGSPLFPFQAVGTEIAVPFAKNFHFCCSHCKLISIITMHGRLKLVLRSI